MAAGLGRINEWHVLFDALCTQQGHLDNGRLAQDYCRLTRRGTQSAFKAALKNLNNWRSGQHTPSRRNFRILTLLLGISELEGIRDQWNRLYEDARRRHGERAVQPGADAVSPQGADGNGTDAVRAGLPERGPFLSRWSLRPAFSSRGMGLALVIVVLLAGATAGVAFRGGSSDAEVMPASGPSVIDMTGQQISAREVINVKVGDSMVVHGKRGHCGEQPPSWEETLKRLPQLFTGVWSDGGVGFRISRSCGGATPARAVVFTATRAGEERFMLYDDPVAIQVQE